MPYDSDVTTFTGKQIRLRDMQVEDVDLRDIAWSLAHTNRYNGHCPLPRTVAAHSIRMTKWVRGSVGLDTVAVVKSAVLLHDAAEAYIGDISAPLKDQTKVGEVISPLEWHINDVIHRKFGLEWPLPEELREYIKVLDKHSAREEMRAAWPKLYGAPDDPEFTGRASKEWRPPAPLPTDKLGSAIDCYSEFLAVADSVGLEAGEA